MPIRIKRDRGFNENDNRKIIPPNNDRGGGSGFPGGGILKSLLPILIGLVMKKPKIMIPIIIIGGLFYFMKGCDSSTVASVDNSNNSSFARGADLDEKVYDKAEVFAPLASVSRNTLPEKVSLAKYCPPRLNQGQQGSCVGWASSYAARSILYAKETNQKLNTKTAFSPAYVYNKIALQDCQGSFLLNAMKTMHQEGDLRMQDFPYNERTCTNEPSSSQNRAASPYKIKGYNRLSKGGNNYKTDLQAIKQNLAQGAPVVIGMMVGGTFMQGMAGHKVWRPTQADYSQRGFGGHAMCVIGYDDYLDNGKGGFQIMNSWGPEWGENGIGWISYKDFKYFTKEAYGLYPMGNTSKEASRFDIEFGLLLNKSGKHISLKQMDGNYFEGLSSIKPEQEFKIEVTNTVECYTYVFGQETDESSFVLFPYTAKHSPYCGITGTRVFPHDHSMYPDDKGNKDFMAIVVTKKPLDYTSFNKKISAATGNYAQKLKQAIGGNTAKNIQYSGANGNMKFSCRASDNEMVGVVLAFNK